MNNTENLEKKLQSMYVSWRNVLFTRGVAQSFGFLIACIIAGCLLDMSFNLSFGLRLLLMLSIYVAVCAFTWLMWLKEYLKPFSLQRMAWLIEKTFPDLNEKLISSVELSKEQDKHISLQLIGKILEDVNVDLAKIKPHKAFPITFIDFRLPVIIIIVFIIALFIPQLHFPLLLNRVMLPSTADASIGSFAVLVMDPINKTFNEGDTITFKASVTKDGEKPPTELVIEGKKISRFLMDYNREDQVFEYKYSCGREGFSYWVTAEDCKSKTYKIQVNKRPAIENFNISYRFPKYTKLDALKVKSTSGDIKALVNTKVQIDVKATDKLKEAKITIADQELQGKLSPDAQHAVFNLDIKDSQDYTINLIDPKGLTNKRQLKYHITALEDKSPFVKLITPENDLSVFAEDEISLSWESQDDFGIKKQMLVIVPEGEIKSQQIHELKPDVKEHKIKLADLKIKYGGDAEIFIRAEDDAGHQGNSQRRIIHIGGLRFKDSQQYISEVEKLQKALKSVKNRLHIYTELFARFDSVNGNDQAEQEHQERMLDQQLQQIQSNLTTAMESAHKLKSLGFFNKSSFYTELVKRYIRQVKLYNATQLTDPEQMEKATSVLDEMVALNRKMASLLKQKAYQNIVNFKSSGIRKRLFKASLAKRLQIRQEIFKMADGMQMTLFNKIKTDSKNEQPGLYRFLHTLKRGEFKNYANPGTLPQKVNLDLQINFPNTKVITEKESFAVNWYGEFKVDQPGKYTFTVTSDDGARLYINNKLIINNDGVHNTRIKSGSIDLKKGSYPLGVTYFNYKNPGTVIVQIQAPKGKLIILGPEYLSCSGFLSVNHLLALLSANAKQSINDYKILDRTANEIMKKLIKENKQLKQLAAKLEAKNNRKEWNRLEKVAEEMRKMAEKEQDKEKKLDQKLVADVIKKAAEDKNAETLRKLAENLPQLKKQQDLKDVEKSVAKLKEKFAEKIPNLEKAVDKKADREAIKDRVDELAKEVEKVSADIEAANKLNNQSLDVGRQIDNLKNELKNMAGKVDRKQESQIKPDTQRLSHNIDNPENSIKQDVAANKEKTDLARDRIKQLADSKTDKLNKIKKEIADLAKKDKIAGKKDDVGKKLAELANDLRDEAASEIDKDKPNTDSAKEKVALASILDKAKEKIAKDAAETPANMQDSLQALNQVNNLMEKHEKMDKSQLSAEEARKEHENILDTAKKANQELQKLLDEIDKVSALKNAEKDIQKLADSSEKMQNRANKQQAQNLANKTDQEKDNLQNMDPNALTKPQVENQWQESDIAKNREKQPDSNHIARQIDEMRKKVAQAEAHKNLEDKLNDELQKHNSEFQKLANKIDQYKLDANQKKRLEEIKNTFPEKNLGEKRNMAEELARNALKQDKQTAKELKNLAKNIAKDQPKENQRNQQANAARQQDEGLKNQAEQLKQALKEQSPSEKQNNEKVLDDLKRNAMAQDYEAVKDNLDALEKNLNKDLVAEKPQEMQEDINAKRADVLTALNDAIRKSREKEQKDQLAKAKKAALAGDLDQAKALTQNAIKDKQEDIKLAKELAKAQEYQKQNVKQIKKALEDVKQNKFAEAAAKLNDSPQAKAEQAKLQKAAKDVNEGIKDAMQNVMGNPKKPNYTLQDAANKAMANQLENASQQAKKAGDQGKAALENFDQALAAKKQARQNLDNMMKDAQQNNTAAQEVKNQLPQVKTAAQNQLQQLQKQQQTNKSPELAKQVAAMNEKKNNLKHTEDLLKQNKVNEAAEFAKSASKGAYEANQALNALNQAIQDQKQLAQMKQDQTPPISGAELGAPIQDLQNAESSLNKGQVKNQATKSLQSGADKLNQMAQNSANSLQSQLAKQSRQAMPSSEGQGKGSERQGDSAQLADGALKDKGKWQDIDSTMSGENETGQKTHYSSYFRKANKEYLNKVSKESKKWE